AQRRKGQQEADGLHWLGLLGESAPTHAGAVGGDLVSRSGSASGAAAQAPEQALLGRTQPRNGRRGDSRPGPGISTSAGGDRHASQARAMARAFVRWTNVVGNGSAHVL